MFEIKEILPGVLILIFSLYIFIGSFSLQSLQMNPVGSDFLPRVVSVLAILGSAIINFPILKRFIKHRRKNFDPIVNGKAQNGDLINATSNKYTSLKTLGLITIYITTIGALGFLISTSLYLFVQIVLLAPKEKRKFLLFGIVSILFSFGIYIVFRYVFTIVLPEGILG
jgi:hypothetical protein